MAKKFGERWEIQRSLGEGGQGFTYLVKDIQQSASIPYTPYVLKRLKNLESQARRRRFEREIDSIRELSHPNVLQLIDYDLQADKPYLVTEYCSGGDLERAKPFWQGKPEIIFEMFEEVCEGILYAHDRGIVHRDVKPANIFLRSKLGPAVVGDFGICYLEEDETRITSTDEAVGPRLFIAPELEDGKVEHVSSKSDVYSLGKLLYWMFRGRVFNREKHRETDWDLRRPEVWKGETVWANAYMEHVNRLFDDMIVADPGKRLCLADALTRFREVKRLVLQEFNPIAEDVRLRPCRYCGEGKYERQPSSEISFPGLSSANGDWRVLVCDACGNVQLFQIDRAYYGKDWWID
jgi:serine/threonine protein kinase